MSLINQSAAELEDWVQVAEVGQIWQGELIAGRLRESGIDAQLVDQTFHQEPLPSVRAFAVVRVVVPRDQEQQARRLISEGFELPEEIEVPVDEADDEPQ